MCPVRQLHIQSSLLQDVGLMLEPLQQCSLSGQLSQAQQTKNYPQIWIFNEEA